MDITTKSEVVKISPAKALTFLNNNNFHLQRALKSSQIASLTTAMRSGEFPPGTAIYFVQTPKSLELIDGQHRFRAQIAADIDIDYTVVTLESDDGDAASSLYTQFDIGTKRSITDRMKALNLTTHVNLPAKQAQLLAAGAPYLKYRFGKITPYQMRQITPLQRLDTLKEFEKGAILFFECMAPAEKWISKAFMRPHFVALGTYLCQYAPEQAKTLWTSIAANNCGGILDPRSNMFNLALKVETDGLATRRAIVIAQAFIRGWNTMIQGKELSTKLTPASIPAEHIQILGIGDLANAKTVEAPAAKTQDQVVGEVMEKLASLFPKNETA